MSQYHKINGLWKRSEDGKRVLPEYSREEFEYLAYLDWVWREKVDGTNVRLTYKGREDPFYGHVDELQFMVKGKTDRAELHRDLVAACCSLIDGMPSLHDVFPDATPDAPVVLYGEGYGAGIQKGGAYRPDKGFVLFDVRVGKTWLRRADVEELAVELGLDVVPVIATCSIPEAVTIVREEFRSAWDGVDPEGLVGTPAVDLADRRGQRVITKIKWVDVLQLAAQGDLDKAVYL